MNFSPAFPFTIPKTCKSYLIIFSPRLSNRDSRSPSPCRVKWETIGHALTRPSQLPLRGTAPSGGVFAPTLRYHNGTYYMTTTFFDAISPPDHVERLPRSFYVKTTNIWDEDSWSEPVYFDQWGIDPDIFFDDDGRVYLTSTSAEFVDEGTFANWITEIDMETGNSLSDTRLLHTSTVSPDIADPLTEASHLYKINGTYYMITADSGTAELHSTNNYRSQSLDGPWEHNPHNPLLFNGADMANAVLATGHADMVEAADGSWWAVFLATRPQNPTNSLGRPQLGRETFLCPVHWDDGWPIFNHGKPVVEHEPDLLYDLERPRVWRDDFDGMLADKNYYFLRAPYKEFMDWESAPGKLRMRGNPYTLAHRDTPAALLRKQDGINQTFSTELSAFEPTSPRQEAGAAVYLSLHFHNEIAVTLDGETGDRTVVVRTRTGPEATLNETYIPDEAVAAGQPVRFFIEARDVGYRLGYAAGNDTCSPKWVASVENHNLQAFIEGWQNFVGTHFAIYTTGNKQPILNHAVSTTLTMCDWPRAC